MSLINKMLQDLDARGGEGARADASSLVRPVSYGARKGVSTIAVGVGLLVLVLLGGGGFAAWKYMHAGRPAGPAQAGSRTPQGGPTQQAAQQNGPVAAATADEGPPVVPGNISPEAHREAGEKLARQMEERNAAARRAAAAATTATASVMAPPAAKTAGDDASSMSAAKHGAAARQAGVAQQDDAAQAEASAEKAGAAPVKPKPRLREARATELARAKERARTPPSVQPAPPATAAGDSESGLSAQQKAENEYRRALAKLQDARVSEAIASLEQAVRLYPRHEAARQTLVGLLLEAGRTAEATRHLAAATELDPRQLNMAMLLARVQLENGGNAMDTLQRSLPYAESNADYRAMMAGVLQRSNRNKEAIEHYEAALRLQPANGVWWMGMGISLQAEKRNAEARAAYQRAKESGRLTPELQIFVERRLQQVD